MQKYKEDSPFVKGCKPDGFATSWEPKKFKYKWLELWQKSTDGFVGLAKISKKMPLYWRSPKNLIYGVIVLQAGFHNDQEWVRVLRKTADSVIIPNPEYNKNGNPTRIIIDLNPKN
jgi:hypothetical protein